MSRTLILFGSTSGNTERVAENLAGMLPEDADIAAVSSFAMETLQEYDRISLGASTWGVGDRQDDWAAALPDLARQDLSGKTAALFGLSDADGYGGTFVDGMGELHTALAETGARWMGFWSADGDAFDASKAQTEGRLWSLVLHTLPALMEAQGIVFHIKPAGAAKINIFFGDPDCVEIVKRVCRKPLQTLTPKEDFILGRRLGDSRLVQVE